MQEEFSNNMISLYIMSYHALLRHGEGERDERIG